MFVQQQFHTVLKSGLKNKSNLKDYTDEKWSRDPCVCLSPLSFHVSVSCSHTQPLSHFPPCLLHVCIHPAHPHHCCVRASPLFRLHVSSESGDLSYPCDVHTSVWGRSGSCPALAFLFWASVNQAHTHTHTEWIDIFCIRRQVGGRCAHWKGDRWAPSVDLCLSPFQSLSICSTIDPLTIKLTCRTGRGGNVVLRQCLAPQSGPAGLRTALINGPGWPVQVSLSLSLSGALCVGVLGQKLRPPPPGGCQLRTNHLCLQCHWDLLVPAALAPQRQRSHLQICS